MTVQGPREANDPWKVAQQVVVALAERQQQDRREDADELAARLGREPVEKIMPWLSIMPEELAAVTIVRAQGSEDSQASDTAQKVLSIYALPGGLPGIDNSANARIMARYFLLMKQDAAEDCIARLWGDQPVVIYREIAEFDPRAAASIFAGYPPAREALADVLSKVDYNATFRDAYDLRQQGRTKEAFMALAKAIAKNPQEVAPYTNMGNLFNDMGLEELAVNEYKRSTEMDPEQGNAWYCLGCLYMSFKVFECGGRKAEIIMYPEAIRAFKKAIEINPDDVDARLNLGVAFAETGRIDEAKEQFRRVLELAPDDELALKHLRTMESSK
ncbi:tetratricopeptide repeat protein [Planctomycetota bacterium]